MSTHTNGIDVHRIFAEEGFGVFTDADGSVRQGYWSNGELVE